MDKLSKQLFVQTPQLFASQATQMESLAVLFIQLLEVRQNHPFGSCNNIGTICGNDTKSILAQWSICLMHPSQPVWLTNVRLGKIEWKENKKKMSVVCCHCSNKPSLTGVIVRRHAHPNSTLSRLIICMRKTTTTGLPPIRCHEGQLGALRPKNTGTTVHI